MSPLRMNRDERHALQSVVSDTKQPVTFPQLGIYAAQTLTNHQHVKMFAHNELSATGRWSETG